ncbi:hypothetical protein [Gracilimonas mengyeensis]|uniref:Uncharacterized protein n=1 Tax=Gracilimonas mengyeensis TaxID=1302730 RepID=A0A521C0V4_9BACT|nr:hypothetical protein [Gracilimonas mengyeensis]SMO53092.1 hypothetical protein SAMN06265219_10458 [Gracilimonas mengyeensis]
MSTKFKNLKNDLRDLEEEGHLYSGSSGNSSKVTSSKIASYILLLAFIATLTFYAGSRFDESADFNPIEGVVQNFNQPSEDLLNRMGDWMQEMGYGELSREQLIDLREEGVTATYTSQMREAGYTDLTLEQLVELQNADVSATFTRMMKELGYELSVQDLIDLRRGSVTAFFTSNMMDLGYTLEELSKENLIRMRSVNVTHQLAERLIEEQSVEETGTRPSVDELIRYRISNQ